MPVSLFKSEMSEKKNIWRWIKIFLKLCINLQKFNIVKRFFKLFPIIFKMWLRNKHLTTTEMNCMNSLRRQRWWRRKSFTPSNSDDQLTYHCSYFWNRLFSEMFIQLIIGIQNSVIILRSICNEKCFVVPWTQHVKIETDFLLSFDIIHIKLCQKS